MESSSKQKYLISDIVNKAGLCKFIWLIFFVDGFSMLLDGFDYMVVSYTMSQIAQDWQLTPIMTGSLQTWAMIGLMVGSILGGRLSDIIGRRHTMVLSVVVFSVFTFPIYFAPSYPVFAVLRVCAGVGLGAFFPISATLVSEFAPAKHRALLVSMTGAFQTFGWVLAGLATSMIIPVAGWRPCYLLAAVGVIFILIVNFVLPESPYYLLEKGRKADAAKVVERICRSSSKIAEGEFDLMGGEALYLPPKVEKAPAKALFGKGILKTTLGFWALYFLATFIVYGINPWLPSLLLQKGSDLATSYGYSIASNLTGVVASLLVGPIVEVLGRKRGIASGFAFTILGLLLVSLVGGGNPGMLMFTIVVMSLGTNFLPPSIVPACAEAYPTSVRNTGVGIMQSISRISGMTAPLFVGALVAAGLTFSNIFMVFLIPAVLGILAAFAFLRKDMRGIGLDNVG